MRGLFGVLTGVFCLLMVTTGGHATMRTQTVDYQVGDTAMQGMLVWDDAVQTPRPGLLMIPNWRGIYGPPDMPDYAVEYWEGVLAEVVETPSWTEAAEKNQWVTTFMTGDELDTYLKDTNDQVTQAFEQIGSQ